ncbi:DUF4199 domain-containing protein [Nafulsella turpanensis]|uniref:DUF4199 domain-containing protein n=1 Tax=Nafulsella turpanensis TaxID=1265690 RepID=UPI00034C94E2|nr:DUF4199 domain-containing protein [Nafulsella turpanensis]
MDKSQLYKVPLKYGIGGGFIAIALFLTLYYSGADPISDVRPLDFILLPIFIFFSIKELRDYKFGGTMFYWQGMTVGFVCYLLIALLSASFLGLFLEVIDPALFLSHKQENIAILTADSEKWVEQIGADAYKETLASLKGTTVFSLVADDFLKKVFIGFLATTIIAIIFKRTK